MPFSSFSSSSSPSLSLSLISQNCSYAPGRAPLRRRPPGRIRLRGAQRHLSVEASVRAARLCWLFCREPIDGSTIDLDLDPLFLTQNSLAAVDSDATDAEVEDKLGFQLEALSKQVNQMEDGLEREQERERGEREE